MNRIKEGDKVNIYFSDDNYLCNCTVLYTPCATGDSWILEEENGSLIHVQQFELMRKI